MGNGEETFYLDPQKGSFVDPGLTTHQIQVREGQKILQAQVSRIQANLQELENLSARFGPEHLLRLRLEELIAALYPAEEDDGGLPTNLDRIDFEVKWNDTLLELQQQAITWGQTQPQPSLDGIIPPNRYNRRHPN